MPFRPSCIICCSDCDADGLFTSCQHFLCGRCSARYPPAQCPRCRKPCKAVKAGAALPKEIADRIGQDPQRLIAAAAQAIEFQRRQEQQTLQRLREIVTTLNQSNRSMATQINAAKTERENLLNTIKRLQNQLYTQQQQHHHQLQQQQLTQRPPDAHVMNAATAGGRDNNGGSTLYTSAAATQNISSRASPFRIHGSSAYHQSGTAPSPTSAALHSWLASPAGGGGAAAAAVTPLGWSHSKRLREDEPYTPTRNSVSANGINVGNGGNVNSVVGGESARFRLATPAITLRNALSGSRDNTPVHHNMDCSTASAGAVGMGAPKPLQSLLCRGP
ncbi:putative dynein heavy chain, cytosolic [Trypanosoma theileri]|uniref:Putative dynein heavy chain, cytosolic n=1 Tax=Trypanosoma theileri TaxID=67003 RepID=A0A1X0NN87_9TRYP|nr:putative dynein heavy chain, cytosolic [Trypanosoma theileri]ORC86192.1 putative dynein heavy chain, cytosolic [Trypanosoma theileri]